MVENTLTVFECRNYIKNNLRDMVKGSCRTENDEEYERVIATFPTGYFFGHDMRDIQEVTGMHLSYIWVSPAGQVEFLWVRSK